jgi:putative transposase
MLIFLTTLLVSVSSVFRSRAALELENLALRHQIGVLQRSARKRPRLTPVDRLLSVERRIYKVGHQEEENATLARGVR